MTWREKVLVKVLLIVARIFADDPEIALEVKNLSTHISVHAPEQEVPRV